MVINVSTRQKMKLANLKPFQRGITIDFKVMKTDAVRKVRSRNDGSNHQVADVLVGDETGVMYLTLWDDDISLVDDGDVFRLVGGKTSLFQGRLQLSLGRNGKLQSSTTTIPEIKTERNLSSESHSSSKDNKGRTKQTDRRRPPVRRIRGFKWTRIERNQD
jgi:replication factor A1